MPTNDIMVVPAIFGASKLGGVFLADMNGDGIVDNGDRLYFVDDGTVGGAGTGGLYVATWNTSNTNNPWNTPNNAAAAAAGFLDYWSTPVRLGDAPVQTGSTSVGQLRGLTGTVINSTTADLYTTAYDNVANDYSIVQQWVDSNTGASVASATQSGGSVTITTSTPNSFTTGQVVEVDGVGANSGATAITSGYNGAWSITRLSSTQFSYTDTNSGASSLGSTTISQGAVDVTIQGDVSQQNTYPNFGIAANGSNDSNNNSLTSTFGGTVIEALASGSDLVGTKFYGDIGLRGVAFAPVAATSIILTQSPSDPLSPTTSVTLTATLTNSQVTPSGQVAFIDENTNTVLGFGTISTSSPYTATLTLSSGLVGNHYVQAYFAGGGSLDLASARSNTIQVIEAGSAQTTTTLASSLPNGAAIGKSFTLTATVSGSVGSDSTPTGTVSFFNGTLPSTTSTPVAGSITGLSSLLGTASVDPVTAISVTAAGSGYSSTPTITFSGGGGTGATANAIVSGGQITGFTITSPGTGYTSAPTVTITDTTGTGASGSATFGSGATLTTALNSLNPVSITAASEGTGSSSTTVTVSAANNFSAGEVVNISGIAPTGYDGNVTITAAGSTSFAYTAASGLGSATLSSATASDYIYAIYNGDNSFSASSSSITQTIAADPTAVITPSQNNVAINTTQAYTATISGNSLLGSPTGSVIFKIVSATTNSSGSPLISTSSSSITLTPGANNTATALWTGPELTAPGSYLVTITYTAAASSPYSSFAITAESSTYGNALIETVQQAFTPGDLVAVQRGDGNVNLGSSGYLVFLDEYTPSGTLVQSIAMPNQSSGSTNTLLLSGQNGSEGLINRSANGYDLTLAGYDLPVGHTFVTSTFPYQYPRTIAEINGAASVNTSTAISTTQVSITAASEGTGSSSTTVTVTTPSTSGLSVGEQVVITGITPSGYDGLVTIKTLGSTSFTYTAAANLGTATLSSALATSSAVPYNPLDVVSNDGNEFYLASNLPVGDTTDNGILYVGSVGATSATQLGTSNSGAAAISISGGQLYITKGSGDVQAVGTGVPTSASQTLTSLPNLATAYANYFPGTQSPEQILLLNTNDGTSNNPNVAYIADQANGLLKFYKDSNGNWQYGSSGSDGNSVGVFGQKLIFAGGATGVVGYVVNPGSNAQIQLYVTGANTTGSNPNQLDSFLDTHGGAIGSGSLAVDNGFPSGNFTNLGFVGGASSAGSPNGNENFAGLAFVPGYVTSTTLSDTGPGSTNVFTATVTSISGEVPTGVVVFSVDGTVIGQSTINANGIASFSDSSFPTTGSHVITGAYQGSVTFGTSTGTITQGSATIGSGDLIVDQVGSASVTVTGITESGTTATVTTGTVSNFGVGQTVTISGDSVSGYNKSYTITATPTPTTFTVTATNGLGNDTVGGASASVTFSGSVATSITEYSATTANQTSPVQSITLPIGNIAQTNGSDGSAFTEGATATSEGYLTDSANGQTATIAGLQHSGGCLLHRR